MTLHPTSVEQADFVTTYQTRIDQLLENCLSFSADTNPQLQQAMRYSVLNGGKRFRPLLVYASGLSMGATVADCDVAAIAIELIHCFSLVHDDMPAMDDDDLRRGVPTCHKKFSEATALLVGDALIIHAHQLIIKSALSADKRLLMLQSINDATGIHGMIGGQMLDIAAEQCSLSLVQLEKIHSLKTAKLIISSLQLGAIAAGCKDSQQLTLLEDLGQSLGLAFQIQDDLLDIEGCSDIIGKQTAVDNAHQKATYPAIMGIHGSKQQLGDVLDHAARLITQLNLDSDYLSQIFQFMVARQS